MAEKELSLEQLVEEFEYHKRQYEDMEAVYQLQVKQKLANPTIIQATKELQDTREACVASMRERDALLDRIVELERSTRMHKDAAITSRRGTARESRLRARLLPSLNEPLKTENDPHATSRHVGPDAAHRVAQQQAAAMQYEQTLGVKSEADRAIVKLPKRARPSKGGGGGTRNATATMAASVHIFPNEPPYRTSEGEMGPVTANGGGP